jgi:predicted nucleic acid-binding protein
MDLAVDTSVFVAVLLEAPEREELIALTTGANLLAPESVHWEIGNAFSAMLKRKRLTMNQVAAALSSYQRIPIRYVDVDLREALRFTEEFNVYAYDGYVLACARRHHAPLVSLDRGMLAAAKRAGIAILEVKR